MNAIKRFISIVPAWALLPVLMVVFVNTTYLYYRQQSDILWLLIVIYLITLLFSLGSTYILYKKPSDPAARVFFVYLHLFAMASNAGRIELPDPIATFISVLFIAGTVISVSALIHFHLIFPKPSLLIKRHSWLPWMFYSIGFIELIVHSGNWILSVYFPSSIRYSNYLISEKISLMWVNVAVFIAIGIAVYQLYTIKSTLARNQVRIVIIGSLFGFITPMLDGLFFDYIETLIPKYPWIFHITHGPAILIMAACFMVAILRYRIWGTEVFIRKGLLYLFATFIIICTYLIFLFLIDRHTSGETATTRFISLALSVLIFMVLRDNIQHLIERFFNRESYDSASVVSDFETRLTGIYHTDELSSAIANSLNEIFHFKSFVFYKRNEKRFEPVYLFGFDEENIHIQFPVEPELDRRLSRVKVFSPEELSEIPISLKQTEGELIVPLLQGDRTFGFFYCGSKKSEKSYSLQDIRVLSLLGQRTVALFHTAALYQKDLNRQLMLERERARISQDMHDDVGASLTRISMMSDLVKNKPDIVGENKEWLGQISDTSRGVIEEMNQIIWALNPKNDNLEGLVAYLRRFTFDYLEPTPVTCNFDMPEDLPDRALNVEVRRNVYLVCREALHNVVKHSGATQVWINLVMNENGFSIRIKDDGKGFDPEKLDFPGNGLINMKKRMDDIGGEFGIRSKIGEGTQIELLLKGD